ncbi:hypothetical protein [Streptomyces sp. NPDC088789]|uniref:hypothetical protein n=1 Tax=Streptomyces sp. NPDC088789 TaxID=3365899 RepID=UPI00382CF6EC
MYDTHTPAEWTAAFGFAALLWSPFAAVVLLAPLDFGALALNAALTVAALTMLLTAPAGGTR